MLTIRPCKFSCISTCEPPWTSISGSLTMVALPPSRLLIQSTTAFRTKLTATIAQQKRFRFTAHPSFLSELCRKPTLTSVETPDITPPGANAKDGVETRSNRVVPIRGFAMSRGSSTRDVQGYQETRDHVMRGILDYQSA